MDTDARKSAMQFDIVFPVLRNTAIGTTYSNMANDIGAIAYNAAPQ